MHTDNAWTYPSLHAALMPAIDTADRKVVLSDASLGVTQQGNMLAFVELSDDRRAARIFFATNCQPHAAACIAMCVNSVIPTIVDMEYLFNAQKLFHQPTEAN